MNTRPLVTTQQIVYLCSIIIIIFIVITARLFYLQVQLNTFFFYRGQRNFLRYERVASPRGNIYDRNHILLATNRPITSLYWQGSGKSTFDDQQRAVLMLLETILNFPLLQDADLQYAERRYKRFMLAEELHFEQLSVLLEQFPCHANIVLNTHFKRCYPHQTVACHVLGHLQSMQDESGGKMGLEKMLEDTLRGSAGTTIATINSSGKRLDGQEVRKALAGDDVHTTLDFNLQTIAERVFPPQFPGALLIMNPRDGALNVMLSRPSFDPNMFLQPISQDEWQALQDKRPFLNRIFEVYPPASPFKLIVLTAAIEHDLIDTESTWYCSGSIDFCGRIYHCNNTKGHGRLTLKQALAKSCNIPFFEIAKKIKIDILAEYAHKFGFGQPTHCLFPEKTGLVPNAQWKRLTFRERWFPGETLSAAIGQGYYLASPLQMARLISAICEGYLVRPRILLEEPIEITPLDISYEVRMFLKKALKQVVKKGSGQSLRTLKDLKIFAKTGTAQVCSLEKREEGRQFLEHGWLLAHIQYKDYEPFTLVILLEHASSSRVSTSVAKQFLKQYCYFMDHGTLPPEGPLPAYIDLMNTSSKFIV